MSSSAPAPVVDGNPATARAGSIAVAERQPFNGESHETDQIEFKRTNDRITRRSRVLLGFAGRHGPDDVADERRQRRHNAHSPGRLLWDAGKAEHRGRRPEDHLRMSP